MKFKSLKYNKPKLNLIYFKSNKNTDWLLSKKETRCILIKNIVNIEIDLNTTFEELTYEINSDDYGLEDREQKFEKA